MKRLTFLLLVVLAGCSSASRLERLQLNALTTHYVFVGFESRQPCFERNDCSADILKEWNALSLKADLAQRALNKFMN